jgi:hypothetical protein
MVSQRYKGRIVSKNILVKRRIYWLKRIYGLFKIAEEDTG